MNDVPALRAAVTVSLVPEVRGGPFVFWDGVAAACDAAAGIGFHGIELFPSAAEAVPVAEVRASLDEHGLALAAVGTGAGGVVHGLSLAHRRPRRTAARGGLRARHRRSRGCLRRPRHRRFDAGALGGRGDPGRSAGTPDRQPWRASEHTPPRSGGGCCWNP